MDSETLVIHFVEDGLSVFSRVRLRGEELEVVKGSTDWQSTLDAAGDSWLESSEEEQIERWGAVMFREGRWPGGGFDTTDPSLTADERAALEKANKAREAMKKAAAVKKTAAKKTAATKTDEPPVDPAPEVDTSEDEFLEQLNSTKG